MSFPAFLNSFGIELPSIWFIAGSILFGIVGLVGWNHGRRTQRAKPKWIGLALMLYPYVTPETWLMLLAGTALSVWLYFEWD
jgi:hypothetical protein